MDLNKIVKEKKQDLAVWADFKGIFEIELLYTDRPAMERMLERCKVRRWVKHQEIETPSDEKFNAELAGRVSNWRSLTLGKLAALINIDVAPGEESQVVPYSEKNAVTLVTEVYGLNNFIRETISDLMVFRENRLENEIKNSTTSQGAESA